MKRRWIGVVGALLLAGVGTFAIVQYVDSAEARALEGQETAQVLVVADTVEAGTPASDIATRVESQLVPAKVQAPDSVSDIADLTGYVAAVDLVPGEQLIASRFVEPEVFADSKPVEVPADLVEVTVSLSPERAVGGSIRPGDEVAVFASFDPFDVEGVLAEDQQDDDAEAEEVGQPAGGNETGAPDQTPNSTRIIVHKVLVTNVQAETLPQEPNPDDETVDTSVGLAPTGNLLVTLAVEPGNAERLVFTSEFGYVWLGAEGDSASEEPTPVQTRVTVYVDELLLGISQ